MGNGAVKETPSHNTFLQIVIWGFPAIQTIVALIAKLVDADELLGTTFRHINNLKLTILVTFRDVLHWKSIR